MFDMPTVAHFALPVLWQIDNPLISCHLIHYESGVSGARTAI
jgi:hypothetical protein